MKLVEAAVEFCLYLEAEKASSPLTIASYRSDIRDFMAFVNSEGIEASTDDVTTPLLRRYLVHLTRRGLKPATRARRLHALRSFWRFMEDAELVSGNPCRRISVPKRDKTPAAYLIPEECQALLDATGAQHYTALATRDRAILSILIYCGLRRRELLNLRLPDIDLAEATLRVVRGKGGKSRIIPLVPQVAGSIGDWLKVRPRAGSDALFLGRDCRPLQVHGLYGAFRRAAMTTGLDRPGVSLHTLRHSFATMLLHSQVDLFSLQKLLGHASIESTTTYLHVDLTRLRAAVASHPMA
jgi:site-specific recombinase XerD